jgi:putative ABC transport system ATP-binding protein
LINRLDEPQEGKKFFYSRDTATIPPQELRSRIGLVMQEANLFPGTVKNNIQFGPKQKGITLIR